MPRPPQFRGALITNIRDVKSRPWRRCQGDRGERPRRSRSASRAEPSARGPWVGGMLAALTYGASTEEAVKHFALVRKLLPDFAITRIEEGERPRHARSTRKLAEAQKLSGRPRSAPLPTQCRSSTLSMRKRRCKQVASAAHHCLLSRDRGRRRLGQFEQHVIEVLLKLLGEAADDRFGVGGQRRVGDGRPNWNLPA